MLRRLIRIFSVRYSYVVCFIPILYFWIFHNDPFFGDAISTTARAALHFTDLHLTTIFYPLQNDPGHPTLFPFLLASLWLICGKSLWIAHLLILIFAVTALLGVRKLLIDSLYLSGQSKFQKEITATIGVILVAVSPFFVAQNAQILTQLPLTTLFIWAYFALDRENKILFGVLSSLMLLIHLQGIFLLTVLMCYLFFKNILSEITSSPPSGRILKWNIFCLKLGKNMISYFLPAVVVLCIWLSLHYSNSGWWISSPDYSAHRTFASPKQLVYNMAIVIWRLLDFGYFGIYLMLIFGLYIFFKKRKNIFIEHLIKKNYPQHLFIFFLLIIIMSGCISFFLTNSIAHRYFLPVQIFTIILSVELWSKIFQQGDLIMYRLNTHRLQLYIGFFIICGLLICGNFWYYPHQWLPKCIGDGNIVYRDIHPILTSVKRDFPSAVFYSYAPLANPVYHQYLRNDIPVPEIKRLYEANIDTCKYILLSNCVCEFTNEEKIKLEMSWKSKNYILNGIWLKAYYK